jgi:pimeloyl-ACP methyl ester carboxylesterase
MEALADAVPAAAPGAKATGLQRAFIRALLMSQDPQGYASLCKVIADAEAPDYASIKCPVLILAGAEDKTAPLAGCETILKR